MIESDCEKQRERKESYTALLSNRFLNSPFLTLLSLLPFLSSQASLPTATRKESEAAAAAMAAAEEEAASTANAANASSGGKSASSIKVPSKADIELARRRRKLAREQGAGNGSGDAADYIPVRGARLDP